MRTGASDMWHFPDGGDETAFRSHGLHFLFLSCLHVILLNTTDYLIELSCHCCKIGISLPTLRIRKLRLREARALVVAAAGGWLCQRCIQEGCTSQCGQQVAVMGDSLSWSKPEACRRLVSRPCCGPGQLPPFLEPHVGRTDLL